MYTVLTFIVCVCVCLRMCVCGWVSNLKVCPNSPFMQGWNPHEKTRESHCLRTTKDPEHVFCPRAFWSKQIDESEEVVRQSQSMNRVLSAKSRRVAWRWWCPVAWVAFIFYNHVEKQKRIFKGSLKLHIPSYGFFNITTAMRSQSQEISQPRHLTAKGSHSQEISAKRSHRYI